MPAGVGAPWVALPAALAASLVLFAKRAEGHRDRDDLPPSVGAIQSPQRPGMGHRDRPRGIALLLALLAFARASVEPEGARLIVSEVCDGAAANKYLEIFNAGTAPAPLAEYALAVMMKGTQMWRGLPAGSMLAPGAVFVVAHPGADSHILRRADITFAFLSNGNLQSCLMHGARDAHTLVDCVGDTHPVAGAGWDVCGTHAATKGHTLIRASTVAIGNRGAWLRSAGTSAQDCEWIVREANDAASLGWHTFAITPAPELLGSVKLPELAGDDASSPAMTRHRRRLRDDFSPSPAPLSTPDVPVMDVGSFVTSVASLTSITPLSVLDLTRVAVVSLLDMPMLSLMDMPHLTSAPMSAVVSLMDMPLMPPLTSAPMSAVVSLMDVPLMPRLTSAPMSSVVSLMDIPLVISAPMSAVVSLMDMPVLTSAPISAVVSLMDMPGLTSAPMSAVVSLMDMPVLTSASMSAVVSLMDKPVLTSAPMSAVVSLMDMP
ncbi:hypothetical protein T492DRAFT_868940, partial [Pavlovales sp. CCMP2436]